MSLNGLDEQSVLDAFNAAIAEPGGWLVLKYTARDTVALLDSGKSGVTEARNALFSCADKSPLYGLLMFRRKRVLIKYVPEGTSRVLVARANVHFPSIREHYTPHEAVLEITAAEELNDTSLAAVFPLHTGASAPPTGKLDEIMEGSTDDDSGDEPAQTRPPVQQRLTSGTSMSRKELLAKKGMKYKRLPAIPAGPRSAEQSTEPASQPPQIMVEEKKDETKEEHAEEQRDRPANTPPPALSAESSNSPDGSRKSDEPASLGSPPTSRNSDRPILAKRGSVEETRSSVSTRQDSPRQPVKENQKLTMPRDDFDYAALDALLPPPELGPRPVSRGSQGPSGRTTPGRTSASLPAALRSRHKSLERNQAPIQTTPMLTPPLSASHFQLPYSPTRPTSSSSVRSMATIRNKKALTPEKQRLLKALELRQKQQSKAKAAAEAATPEADAQPVTGSAEPVKDDDPSQGRSFPAKTPIEGATESNKGITEPGSESPMAIETVESPVAQVVATSPTVAEMQDSMAVSQPEQIHAPEASPAQTSSRGHTQMPTIAPAPPASILIVSHPSAMYPASSRTPDWAPCTPTVTDSSILAQPNNLTCSTDAAINEAELPADPSERPEVKVTDAPTESADTTAITRAADNVMSLTSKVTESMVERVTSLLHPGPDQPESQSVGAKTQNQAYKGTTEQRDGDGSEAADARQNSSECSPQCLVASESPAASRPGTAAPSIADASTDEDTVAEDTASESMLVETKADESASRRAVAEEAEIPPEHLKKGLRGLQCLGTNFSGTSFLHISPHDTGNAVSSPVQSDRATNECPTPISPTGEVLNHVTALVDKSQLRPPTNTVPDEDEAMSSSTPEAKHDHNQAPVAMRENSARKSDSGIQLKCEDFNQPHSPEIAPDFKDENSSATLNDSLLTEERPARPDLQTLPSFDVGDDSNASVPPANAGDSQPPSSHADAKQPILITPNPPQATRSPMSNETSPSENQRFSGATVDSDLMDAMDAATVHEATLAVQRSPSATFLRRNTSGGNTPTLNQLTAGCDEPEADTSSFGDLLLPTSIFNPRASPLVTPARPRPTSGVQDTSDLLGTSRRGLVKPGISQRIARLEQIRLSQPSGTALPPVSPPASPSLTSDKSSSDRKGLRKVLTSDDKDSVKDRLKNISVFNPRRSSSAARNSISSLKSSQSVSARSVALPSPMSATSPTTSVQETVSVTARIVRTDNEPPVVPPKDDDYIPAELRAPSITIDRKRATWSQAWSAKDRLALSTASISDTGTETKISISPISPAQSHRSSESRLSLGRRKSSKHDAFTPHLSSPEEDTVADLPNSPLGDDADSPRGTNRATRFLKRISTTLGHSSQARRKGLGSLTPSPIKSHVSSAAVSPTKAVTPVLPAISLGGINCQFPNSALWKRRFVEIDAAGTLIVTANKLGFGIHSSTRKYRLTDFVKIYVPDMDVQELVHSIFLDLRDGGGMLQCACEDATAQQHTLQVLLKYHAYWSEHTIPE